MVGVGMTPPKVAGYGKPASSVMDQQHVGRALRRRNARRPPRLRRRAPSLITPPNSGSGGGSCFPLMVDVALGEPRVPVDLLCRRLADDCE